MRAVAQVEPLPAVRDAHSGSHRVYTGVLERVERTLRMRDELEHAIVLVIELASDLVELWAHNLRSRQRGYPCSAHVDGGCC